MKTLFILASLVFATAALADRRCDKAAIAQALSDYASEVTTPYCAVNSRDASVTYVDEENNLLRDQNGRKYLFVSVIPGTNILCGNGLDFYYYYSVDADGKCRVSNN